MYFPPSHFPEIVLDSSITVKLLALRELTFLRGKQGQRSEYYVVINVMSIISKVYTVI